MDKQDVRAAALNLVEESDVMMLGTLVDQGEPHIKAVEVVNSDGLKALWISTNTSSEHVAQLERDRRACLYFVYHDNMPWRGLSLVGRVEIRRDTETRERLWIDGWERRYPLGVTDPDYSVQSFASMSESIATT